MSDQISALLENAFIITGNIERSSAKCRALCGIAEIWVAIGNKTHGLEIVKEALKAVEFLKHPDEKSKHLAWLGRLLVEGEEQLLAFEQFKRAYYLARAAESVAHKVSAFYCLASEYVDAGLVIEARTILTELEPLVNDPQNGVDTVCELINIAELYADIVDPDKVVAVLDAALRAVRSLKDSWFKVERLIEIAEIHHSSGRKKEADNLISEAVNEIDKVEENSRSYFWFKVAGLYLEMEIKTQAIECLRKARETILKSEDLISAVNDLHALAEGYLKLGDLPEALTMLAKGQTIINDLVDDHDRVTPLLKSGELYFRLGEKIEAQETADKVYQINAIVADTKAKIYVLGRLAILHYNLNNIEKAAELVDEICFIVAETKTRTNGLGAIAEELVECGNYDLAFRLAEVIHEPEIKSGVLVAIAKNQVR